MKRIILLSFLTLFVFSITSCDKDKAKTDGDIITDADIITDIDTEKSDEDASKDEDITDIDTVQDEDEQPDTDDICAKVIDYSLLPFKDDKGNLHFCREGCDAPTASDPQCLSNLWKEDNEYFCKNYPEYDCCNYPCNMDNLRPMYDGDFEPMPIPECTVALNAMDPIGWETGYYTFKNFNFQDGKIGFPMHHVQSTFTKHVNSVKAFEYDVKTKKYSVKSLTSSDMLAYKNGNFLTYVTIKDTVKRILTYYSNGIYTAVYPKKVRFIAYTPALTDKWAFANIEERDGSPTYMTYAAVKGHDGTASYENIAWNWVSLGAGIAYDPNIVDDRLVFYMDNFKGYICELDKEPKSIDECRLINRTIDGTMEEIRHPIMDKNNKNLIYYNPLGMTDGFMRVATSKEPWEYKKFTVTTTYEDTYSLAVSQIKGNLISYENIIWEDGDRDNQDNIVCLYRIDKEKSYCPAGHGARSEFDGHYMAWQAPGRSNLYLRDMECYCDMHPEVCPYDDYTPNTECPKNIKTGEHECIDSDVVSDVDTESPDTDA